MTDVCKAFRIASALLISSGMSAAQGQTLSVSDDSSTFTAIKGVDGNSLTDPLLDQQTGQSADDFVGNLNYPGFLIKPGEFGGEDALAFRIRLNTYDVNAINQMNLRLGFDYDEDGALDLYFGITTSAKTQYLSFFQPAAGSLNVSPNTSGFTSMAAEHTYATNASTFSYVQVASQFTNNSNKDTNDAQLTFIATFTQINSALNALYGNTANVGPNTQFLFVAITSTNGNTVNQDAYGYDGLSDVRFDETVERVYGNGSPVPEPATWLSSAVLLLSGLGVWWHRRRRA